MLRRNAAAALLLAACTAVTAQNSTATPTPPPASSSKCTVADARHLGAIYSEEEFSDTPGCNACLFDDPASCFPQPKAGSCSAADFDKILAAYKCAEGNTSCRDLLMQGLPEDCMMCMAAAVAPYLRMISSTGSMLAALQSGLLQHEAVCIAPTEDGICDGLQLWKMTLMDPNSMGGACGACMLGRAGVHKGRYKCVKPGLRCTAADAALWPQLQACEGSGLGCAAVLAQFTPDCVGCLTRAASSPGADCTPTTVPGGFAVGNCQYVKTTCIAPSTLRETPATAGHSGMGAGIILLLVLLIGLPLYCVGGAVCKIATGAERTFPQVLPHWHLWRRLFSSGGQRSYGVQAGETVDNNLSEVAVVDDTELTTVNVSDDAPAEVDPPPSTGAEV
eukprot:TRINITY_DN1119_c0_g4_i1.p1 TRINITY_DN1119_c0_g4~~TRINITY_DN1119_c0_g4_i1.p1  ORF type:complete len:391 (+),score=69.09 TRINITY_DN1119_c0_g4_i1:79-1251(+)